VTEQLVFRLSREGSEASFDARFAPIYVTQFRGRIQLESAEWLDKVASPIFARALSEGKPAFYIVDARGMQSPPATVRRYWADSIERNRAQLSQMLGTIVVVDNAILRGALTAINWLTGRGNAISYVTTFTEAVVEGNRLLSAGGHSLVELNATDYNLPAV
jgi:hypothetical protein